MITISPDLFIKRHINYDDLDKLEEIEDSEKILFKVKSPFNDIQVTENDFGRFLKFSDSYQACKLYTQKYQGVFPYINYFFLSRLLKSDVQNILIAGMGSGSIVHGLLKIFPSVKNIDIVEIDPEIPEIAKKFFDFKQNEKINITIQDARVFLKDKTQKYDLVILDVFSDTGMPYRFMTEEFLREIYLSLNENGILCANSFSFYKPDFKRNIVSKCLIKTYKSVFNDTLIFPTIYGDFELYNLAFGLKNKIGGITNLIIFASKNKFELDKQQLIEKAKSLKENFDLNEIKKIDMYAKDLHKDEINTDNLIIFKDEYEYDSEFDFNDLKKYSTYKD